MNNKFIAPVAVVVTLLLTMIFCSMFGLLGLAVLPFAFLLLLSVQRPKVLLGIFWCVTIVAQVAELVISPILTKVVEQTLGLVVLAVLLGTLVITRRTISGTKTITVMLISFLSIVAVSFVVNRVPMQPFFFYLLTYLKHFWVFYFVLLYAGNDVRPVIRWGTVTFGVQLLFNMVYYMGLNPLPYRLGRKFVDGSIGTFADSSHVAYYIVAMVLVLVGFLNGIRTVRGMFCVVSLMFLCIIQFYFTFTIHAYLLLALGLLVEIFLVRWRSGGGKLIIGLSTAALVIAVLMVQGPLGEASREIFSARRITYRWHRFKRSPKMEAYIEVLTNRFRYLEHPWIGGGPGNYTSRIAFLSNRPLSRLPHMFDLYRSTDLEYTNDRSSVLATPRTGIISLWGELGPGGALLFWGIYVYAGLRIWRQLRRGAYRDERRRTMAMALIPTLAVLLAINVLRDVVVILPLNIGFWIWTATVWNPDPPEEDEQANETVS